MKAIVVTEFGNPDVMKYVDLEIPRITPTQVLIQVAKTSVNYADIKARYGNKGSWNSPFVPGLDAAGVIVEIGAEVLNLKVGQRVIAFPPKGSYAEYVAAEEILTYAIPDSIDFDTAAACPIVSFLSYKMLHDITRIEEGETVLVHSAAGGVGTTAIQMAKLLGAGIVIGTVGDARKAAIASEAGADYVISYLNNNFADRVNELTKGKGVNIVLDSVAGSITEQSLLCLAPFGRLVQFGNSSEKSGAFKTSDLHASCRSVLGFSLGTTRKHKPESLQKTAKQVLQYISEGKLKFEIGHRFPLEEAVMAHKLIESRQSTGKILLDVI
ncbi:zinc-binding dehydrogenase [Bacillus sp. S/N-304-OC-R1]|uniref:quinone oxidoreductase family protein n=1 Tax=Bacillus sp. S/N-304-OC-R1 TaxID=2758034 RepID=UPI001C8EF94A|nr:zinc-binding dehydrogenase [Bacillus sp. S/N-304-OC-R1]MBY0122759.1 zinc-binding dehydrogenase [Bacillus sp. S/N-304-OC-R1]